MKLTVIRGSAAEPHVVELTREVPPAADVKSRMQGDGIGYVRIAAFGRRTADQLRTQIASLAKGGATRLIVDVRNTAAGDLAEGVAAARLFVGVGHAGRSASRGRRARTRSRPTKGDGAVTLPVTLLVDSGTSGPAEIFAAALARQQARRARRRAHDRPRRRAGAREAARRQRALDYLVALSHAGRRADSGQGPGAGRAVDQPEGEFGAPRRPTPSSRKPSSASAPRKPRSHEQAGSDREDRQDTGATKTSAAAAVDSLLDGITRALKKGDAITFVGFGTFKTSQRRARVARTRAPATPSRFPSAASSASPPARRSRAPCAEPICYNFPF